jgi:hypothetical protein
MNVWDLFAVFVGDVFCSFSPFSKIQFFGIFMQKYGKRSVYLCKLGLLMAEFAHQKCLLQME